MEFGRQIGLLGLLRPKTAPNRDTESGVTEHEIKSWEEAFLGKSLFRQDAYAVLVVLRSDPSKKFMLL